MYRAQYNNPHMFYQAFIDTIFFTDTIFVIFVTTQ